MRNKLNITEEESQRILNLHKNTILNENQNYTWKLVKSGGSGAVDKKGIFSSFKTTKKVGNTVKGVFVDKKANYKSGFSVDCSKPDIITMEDSGLQGTVLQVGPNSKKIISKKCGTQNTANIVGGGNKPKPNTEGRGKLNKTNGTYTLGSNQPLKASVDFTTKFPKMIPAGTVVFHDYKKNNGKIVLGNTGVVTYCNRNTFIYNDGIDDLKNDGLMGTLKGIFCNGDKIKTWKELTYTPVDNTGETNTGETNTGETNTGGGGQTHPFDYQTVLNVIKQKFPEEDIINPFEQGGEEEVQSTIVTDKMYAEF
jgi:hypothetical protein